MLVQRERPLVREFAPAGRPGPARRNSRIIIKCWHEKGCFYRNLSLSFSSLIPDSLMCAGVAAGFSPRARSLPTAMTHRRRQANTIFAMYSRWNGRTPRRCRVRKQEVDGRDATRQVRENKKSCAWWLKVKTKHHRERWKLWLKRADGQMLQ